MNDFHKDMDALQLECDCAAGCSIITIFEYDEYFDDPGNFTVDWTEIGEGKDFLSRLKAAWQLLRGKSDMNSPMLHGAVLYPRQVRELRDWLNTKID